jgi:hypothetical protein
MYLLQPAAASLADDLLITLSSICSRGERGIVKIT